MRNCEIMQLPFESDDRGWAIEPFDDEDYLSGRIRNVHIVSMVPGSIRGNHFHSIQNEYIWVLGGQCRMISVDNETLFEESIVIDGDEDKVMVKVPPNISHAFKNVGSSQAYLLCCSDRAHDPADCDMKRRVILE